MLQYTGHPFVDVGIATIAAFAGKKNPETLTNDDLEKITAYIKENYIVNPLKSFLTVAFPNSGFTNPAFEKNPQKRKEYADMILDAWKKEKKSTNTNCVFTGQSAVIRGFRQHIPLVTAEDIINFHPYGLAGLPVSALALLAIHALPLGCAKVEGKLLAVHSDDPDTIYYFAKRFLEQNKKAIEVAQLSGSSKLPEAPHKVATLLIETLLEIELELLEASDPEKNISITAYHFSNSGQGTALNIYYLPLEVSSFLHLAMAAPYRESWNNIRNKGWEIVQSKQSKKSNGKTVPSYNILYEDILKLPENASRFIRCYFLRIPVRTKLKGDPRATYSFMAEPELVSWSLVELFLRKVIKMDKHRIEQIRNLGDQMAEYVCKENAKRFFQAFLTARNYSLLREILIKASVNLIKKGCPPLIKFDPYIEIFEQGVDIPDASWRLVRDLILIRMIERLYESGWLQSHKEELKLLDEINDESENKITAEEVL